MALQPEGNDFQNDAQENRNDVKDGVDGSVEDLLLVNVLTGSIEVENRSRNQHRHQLQCPEDLKRVEKRIIEIKSARTEV